MHPRLRTGTREPHRVLHTQPLAARSQLWKYFKVQLGGGPVGNPRVRHCTWQSSSVIPLTFRWLQPTAKKQTPPCLATAERARLNRTSNNSLIYRVTTVLLEIQWKILHLKSASFIVWRGEKITMSSEISQNFSEFSQILSEVTVYHWFSVKISQTFSKFSQIFRKHFTAF